MAEPQIFITDCDHIDVKQEQQVFEQAGLSFVRLQCKSKAQAIEQCKGARVILNQYLTLDKTVFEALPTLKCVIRYGIGVDNVNLEDADAYGIQVCNVPDYGVHEVADQAMALMLCLVRKVLPAVALTRQGVWEYQRTVPLYRAACQTVGVLGTGRIGSAFAKRACAFGYRIIGCEVDAGAQLRNVPGIEYVDFDTLLAQSDILSVHCSLNQTTRHMLNEQAFLKMKKNAYLVNVSRGGIVDETALDKALEEGQIAGAALDVLETEPMPQNHILNRHQNVIITPHMAWYSEQSSSDLKRLCAEEAVRFVRGEPVRSPVNQPRREGFAGV